MSDAARVERPRGTHDVTPVEQPRWRLILTEAERMCARYGYRPITTPGFEETALFERTSGPGSDVVQKETYTFEDRSGRSLTLRPEGTAPICRAYVDHGMHREPQPVKLYTVGPMYRYSAPQRGRFREHWQLSVEAIGSDDPAVDAEVITLYESLLGRLGITAFRLDLNSIGCRECRPAYLARLGDWLAANADRLDEETRSKAETSPLRVLDNIDAKPEAVRETLLEAPTVGESLCEACRDHFASVRAYLDAAGVAYQLVPTLVRGLDYYVRTTWEFVGPGKGAQSALSGGGRYDGLVEEIGGPAAPGVGFGAGIERLVLALEHAGVAPSVAGIDVFFLVEPGVSSDRRGWALAQMRILRDHGYTCDTDYAGRSRKGQVTQASRLGARRVVEIEPDRIASRGRVVPEDRLVEVVLSEPPQ